MVGGVPTEKAIRHTRRLYRAQNGVWLWVALAAFITTAIYLLDPAAVENTAIGRTLKQPYDFIWNSAYLLGGVGISLGIWFERQRVEIAGHLFLTAALTTNAAALFYLGLQGSTFVTLLGLAVASATRVWFLYMTVVP